MHVNVERVESGGSQVTQTGDYRENAPGAIERQATGKRLGDRDLNTIVVIALTDLFRERNDAGVFISNCTILQFVRIKFVGRNQVVDIDTEATVGLQISVDELDRELSSVIA